MSTPAARHLPPLRALVFPAALLLPVSFAGCGAGDELTVFAAASLTEAVTEAARLFEEQTKTSVSLSFASSSTLARQIGSGADADVFLSANTRWMDYLEERGIVEEEKRIDLLGNRLALVVPKGSGFRRDLSPGAPVPPLLLEGRIAVGESETVPAGIYARQALISLGWLKDLESNLIPCDSVRSALMLVARREADAGIVYLSDLTGDDVEIAGTFPEESHETIVYPAAELAGRNRERGRLFLRFLEGAEASSIFERHGFLLARTGRRS